MTLRRWYHLGPNIEESVDGRFLIKRRPQNGQEIYSLQQRQKDGMYKHIKSAYDSANLKLLVEEMEWIGELPQESE